MAANKPGISLCMIVRDEQDMLKDCLLSVEGVADEILIADTGSMDDTKAVAIQAGAKLFDYPWDESFSRARNYIMDRAAYEWILLLDADERLFPEDKKKLLDLISTTDGDGAHFKVYNHVGRYGDGAYTLHNALRLVRNNKSYHFVGDIHEQIARVDGQPFGGRFAVTDIRIHHLGYLDKVVKGKNKRERNIPMLTRELDKDPENAFMLFNMGNEHMAQKDYTTALDWFYKSKEHLKRQEAFGPHLLFRMALCHFNLGQLGKAVRVLTEGLLLYPGCTDMEYFRGTVYMEWHRDFLAAECFQNAIDMGPPPVELRFSDDCGTSKPLMSLAALHMRQHDWGKAADYYAKAIQADSHLHAALYGMARAYKKMGLSPGETADRIGALFANSDYFANRLMLVDVLLAQGFWQVCEPHLVFLDTKEGIAAERALLWGKCRLRAGDYDKAVEQLSIGAQCDEVEKVLPGLKAEGALLLFCAMLLQKNGQTADVDFAVQMVGRFHGNMGTKLCRQILAVLDGSQADWLKGESATDLNDLFSLILRIVLECGAYDLFEGMLYVYNYFDSARVLLFLGQLYLECGFPQMAAKTILRSAKELDTIDDQGAQALLEAFMQMKG